MRESLSLCERDLVSGSLATASCAKKSRSAEMTSDLPFNPKNDSVTHSSSYTPTIIISPSSGSNMREDTKVGEEKSGCRDLMFNLTNINCPAELMESMERFLT